MVNQGPDGPPLGQHGDWERIARELSGDARIWDMGERLDVVESAARKVLDTVDRRASAAELLGAIVHLRAVLDA